METAKGIVNSASKMVFGENQTQNQTEGVEPVSGQTGEGTADKPHDLGNTTGEPTNQESSTTSTGVTEDPVNTEGSREPKTAATSSAGPDVGSAAPESGANIGQKQQGADRPNEIPEGEQNDAIASKKQDAEDAMGAETGDEPGPAPVGGEQQQSGAGGGQKESLGSTSKEPGTGTKYEKSTGMAAEGGDFDATRPGAGKEADRLLEEKGIHHEGNQGPPQEVPGAQGGDESSGKPSIGQKIKDKLHIGKKE